MIFSSKRPDTFLVNAKRRATSIFVAILAIVCLPYLSSRQAFAQETTVNKEQILNVYNASASKLNQLTKYSELVAELNRISNLSGGDIVVGPMVNSAGTGLLPADETLMNDIIISVVKANLGFALFAHSCIGSNKKT